MSNISFTVSARGKPAGLPIQRFMQRYFKDLPSEQIDSFFGFTEHTTLYGGRIFSNSELSAYDLRSMYRMNINLRLPLTNHHATVEEYEENLPFLEKYYRKGNSIIVTNDDLARWLKRDFPDYCVEASVIKNINNLRKIEAVADIYDTIILPMSSNEDEAFLKSIEDKRQITLFANGGCAFTCPSKMCYPSISKANKVGDPGLFKCSQSIKYRELLGMQDFDLEYFQELGFNRFKLLRARPGNMTGA